MKLTHLSTVVPAQAGTHNPRRRGLISDGDASPGLGVWVPACAGTTSSVGRRSRKQRDLTALREQPGAGAELARKWRDQRVTGNTHRQSGLTQFRFEHLERA